MSLKYKIVIGDSRKMTEVEDASVNYIPTSPPYWDLVVFSDGVEEGSNRDLSRAKSKEEFFTELGKVWAECYRVLKPGGYLTCEFEDKPVGSWTHGYPNEVCLVGPMVESIEKSGLILISRVFWKKFETGAAMTKFQYTLYSNLVHSDPRAISNVAYVFTFKKRGDVTSSRPNQLDFNKEDWKIWVDGFWKIENPASSGEGLSAGAVFPYELVRRLIKIYSSPLDVVLDPFLGTGTTMQVACDLDRSCIGYEALPRMLPFIKTKVGVGKQKIYYDCEWKIIERENHRETGVHRDERGG